MATTIYESGIVELIDGTELYITPLKIRYMREFMNAFQYVKTAQNDAEAMDHLSQCVLVSMKQYMPSIKTTEELEDNVDMPTVYRILKLSAGVDVDPNSEETVKDQASESGTSWEDLDLAKLESEVFLLGIWKDYEELETCLSMPELVATLSSKRELDYDEKKFLAAIQGVDLDQQSGRGQDEWEKMKARVFSGGKTEDSNDIASFQGVKAQKAGFGVGMGIDFEDLTKK